MFELDPYNDWRLEMLELAKVDPWRQKLAGEYERAEPGYLAIYESLSKDQQEALDRYISACEEMQYSLIFSAYEIGKRHALVQYRP